MRALECHATKLGLCLSGIKIHLNIQKGEQLGQIFILERSPQAVYGVDWRKVRPDTGNQVGNDHRAWVEMPRLEPRKNCAEGEAGMDLRESTEFDDVIL